MRNLLLEDLKLGLDDLFGKREAHLLKSATGRTYAPLLRKKRDEITALPEELVGGKPLAQQLASEDGVHDSYGGALYLVLEAYRRLSPYEPELAELAEKLEQALIPGLDELRATYATETAAAKKRLEKLAALQADLARFPTAGGKTLHDWTKRYLEAGSRLDDLLSKRADVAARDSGDRSDAAVLRTVTIGLISRARAALADELDADGALERNLDALVFGYFDELAAMREKPAEGGQPK